MFKSIFINKTQNNIDIFNLLRGIALLCVIGIHTISTIQPVYPQIHYSWLFKTPAWMAMWVFFFLSGYLLGKGFYKGKYNADKSGIINFYISRFIRIAPMYFFFLFILFLFYNPIWFVTHLKAVLHLLTFTYNGKPSLCGVGASWFISTIFQLYIMSPLMYKYVLSKIKKRNFLFLFIFILLGLAYRLITDSLKLDYWQYSFTFSVANIDLFFGGMLLNAITLNSKDNKVKQILRKIAFIPFFLLIFMYMSESIHISGWLYSYLYPTFTLLSLILIVYAFDTQDKKTPAPLNAGNVIKNPIRFIEFLGIISFTFYLYHSNILEMYMKLLENPLITNDYIHSHLYLFVYALMFVTTLILSCYIHYFIEKPINQFRKNMLNRGKND